MTKVAVIAGATTGIGRASAIQLSKDGFDVVLAARGEQRGQKLVEIIRKMGKHADFIKTDMSIEEDVEALFEFTKNKYNHIDFYLGNQGVIYAPKMFDQTTEEDFDKVMSVNVKGAFFGMKYAIKQFLQQGGGNIVIMGSSSGIRSETGFGVYSASKRALLGLAQDAAMEYGKNNIRINVIAPGGIRTPLTAKTTNQFKSSNFKQPIPSVPLLNQGGLGEPEDIASMISYMASDASKYMTGSVISIDGGITL
jgi:NAD(P)-dependent dehydrogenase (short-subunit alcohol dehydrogenase family)